MRSMSMEELQNMLQAEYEEEKMLGKHKPKWNLENPNPISLDEAIEFAEVMLHDFKDSIFDDFENEKNDVHMLIFEHHDGYQVEVICDTDPNFEIYEHLYTPHDVVMKLRWSKENQSEIKRIQIK